MEMNLKVKNLVISILFAFLSSLYGVVKAESISVAVAANVQYAFEELRTAFKQETGNDALGTINSSGKFVAQISNGAPFDVFISADMEFPEKLYKDGMTTGAPKVYAYGALVLWTTKNIDLSHWQAILTGNQVTHIGVANPKAAPYGRETMKVLTALKLDQILQPKLVFGESIAQTNQYIHSGAVCRFYCKVCRSLAGNARQGQVERYTKVVLSTHSTRCGCTELRQRASCQNFAAIL